MRDVRVAVDGSRSSGHALSWAIDVAAAHGARLEVVTVMGLFGPVFLEQRGTPVGGAVDEWVEERQRELLASSGARVPDNLDIIYRTLEGHPTDVLISADPAADLLVIGTRGVGGFVGLLVGSTAHQLIEHAPCPVAVIPDTDLPPRPPGSIVVGVDGSPASEQALRWTLREFTNSTVEAVIAAEEIAMVASPMAPGPVVMAEGSGQAAAENVRRRVAERLGAKSEHIAWTPTVGRPARVLLERAEDADALVLGLPGQDHPTPLWLGSVAHRCLKRSPVPVIVVR